MIDWTLKHTVIVASTDSIIISIAFTANQLLYGYVIYVYCTSIGVYECECMSVINHRCQVTHSV